ncbi:MAG: hypothetical protein KDA94_17065, partial [Acidimicrobiales bacterium]|nr:hypothetical protein [Acidimicrobiales bacterium]
HATLNESYGANFSVTSNLGAFTNNSGTWTLVDGDNTWTFSQSTGVLSLAVASGDPFLAWIDATWPSLSDKTPTGDPDNDGIENIIEYVLTGGDPSVSTTGILPTLDASGANFVFSFTRRAASTADTTQVFQYGNDLSGWTDVPVATGTYGSVVVAVTPAGDDENIVITVPKGVNTELFGRLKVSKP